MAASARATTIVVRLAGIDCERTLALLLYFEQAGQSRGFTSPLPPQRTAFDLPGDHGEHQFARPVALVTGHEDLA